MSGRDNDGNDIVVEETTIGPDVNKDDEMSGEETEQRGRYQLPNQSEENVFNSTTCLYSENPLADVVGKFILFLKCYKVSNIFSFLFSQHL